MTASEADHYGERLSCDSAAESDEISISMIQNKHDSLPFVLAPLQLESTRFSYFNSSLGKEPEQRHQDGSNIPFVLEPLMLEPTRFSYFNSVSVADSGKTSTDKAYTPELSGSPGPNTPFVLEPLKLELSRFSYFDSVSDNDIDDTEDLIEAAQSIVKEPQVIDGEPRELTLEANHSEGNLQSMVYLEKQKTAIDFQATSGAQERRAASDQRILEEYEVAENDIMEAVFVEEEDEDEDEEEDEEVEDEDDDDDERHATQEPAPVASASPGPGLIGAPRHPISSMQGAFEESMVEASSKSVTDKKVKDKLDPAARRQQLLDQDTDEEPTASKWRQQPGQQFHEFWKLVAQISFGSYLLFDGIAKDNSQVLNILQEHVDEVDEFLEDTLADFDQALEDINERLRCLKIPMQNVTVFDQMLADRAFRASIVDGNERIEHVITRTAASMDDALKDVQQGLSATKEFTNWLATKDTSLKTHEPLDVRSVYHAMKGNVQGWRKAFVSLQTKGNHLGIALVQLGSIVAEMDKRAGEVSRNLRVGGDIPDEIPRANTQQFSILPGSNPTSPTSPPQSLSRRKQSYASHTSTLSSSTPIDKELSSENMVTPAMKATLPAFQYVADKERTPEPDAGSDVDSEVEESFVDPVPVYTLQPRTYTPPPTKVPGPRSPPKNMMALPKAELPVQIKEKKQPLRQRFSLRRKSSTRDTVRGEPKPLVISPLSQHPTAPVQPLRLSPSVPVKLKTTVQSNSLPPNLQPQRISISSSPTASISSPNMPSSRIPSPMAPSVTSSPRVINIQRTISPLLDTRSTTPSSSSRNRTNPDSGYYSSSNFTSSHGSSTPISTSTPDLITNSSYPFNPPTNLSYASSPKSEHGAHFGPTLSTPITPLQRPWTAVPGSQPFGNGLRPSTSNSQLSSSYNQQSHLRDPTTLSTYQQRHAHANIRHGSLHPSFASNPLMHNGHHSVYAPNTGGLSPGPAPSISGARSLGGATIGTSADHKLKKKKSGFGWLKKAFSLSEEERAAFEDRRMQIDSRGSRGDDGGYRRSDGYGSDYGRETPRFLDGKRIR